MPATFHIQGFGDHRATQSPSSAHTSIFASAHKDASAHCLRHYSGKYSLCETGCQRPDAPGWKTKYRQGGIEALLSEGRGSDKRSGISEEQKQKIEQMLSDQGN